VVRFVSLPGIEPWVSVHDLFGVVTERISLEEFVCVCVCVCVCEREREREFSTS
jgi:hypothetical protein